MLRRVRVLPNPYGGGTHSVRILKLCPRYTPRTDAVPFADVFASREHALASTAVLDLRSFSSVRFGEAMAARFSETVRREYANVRHSHGMRKAYVRYQHATPSFDIFAELSAFSCGASAYSVRST